MHTKNASLQLDQSLQAVAQALFADGDAVVVSRLPTAVPAARKAAAEGKRYWDRHGENNLSIDLGLRRKVASKVDLETKACVESKFETKSCVETRSEPELVIRQSTAKDWRLRGDFYTRPTRFDEEAAAER